MQSVHATNSGKYRAPECFLAQPSNRTRPVSRKLVSHGRHRGQHAGRASGFAAVAVALRSRSPAGSADSPLTRPIPGVGQPDLRRRTKRMEEFAESPHRAVPQTLPEPSRRTRSTHRRHRRAHPLAGEALAASSTNLLGEARNQSPDVRLDPSCRHADQGVGDVLP